MLQHKFIFNVYTQLIKIFLSILATALHQLVLYFFHHILATAIIIGMLYSAQSLSSVVSVLLEQTKC